MQELVGQGNDPSSGKILDTLTNAFTVEDGGVTELAHDGGEEVAVVAMLAQEIDSSLHGDERQDVDTDRVGVPTGFEDSGVDPGPNGRLREVKELGDLGNLPPPIAVGQVAAYELKGSTTSGVVLVLLQSLQDEEILDNINQCHATSLPP